MNPDAFRSHISEAIVIKTLCPVFQHLLPNASTLEVIEQSLESRFRQLNTGTTWELEYHSGRSHCIAIEFA